MDKRFYLLMSEYNTLLFYELKAEKIKLSSEEEARMNEAIKVIDSHDFWRAK